MRDLHATLSNEAPKTGKEGVWPAAGLDEVVATGQTGRLHAVEVRARQVHQPVG